MHRGPTLFRKDVSTHETWRLWTTKQLQDLLLLQVASGDDGSYTVF
jgi:hypothetical protein